MDLDLFLQRLVDGISSGAIYASLALAIVIVYRTTGVVNFAQGEMAMITSYVAFVLLTVQGTPFYLALPITLIVAFAIGLMLEFLFIRRAKEPTDLSFIIITIGFQMLLFGLAGWKWGADQRRLELPFSDSEAVIEAGGVVITELNLATFTLALGMMLLVYLFLQYTRLGLAMKATQQNEMAAKINGIPTHSILAISFGISSVVGAIAGLLVAPMITLDPTMMWDPLLKGFAAAVLGGMKSLGGVVIGGLLLGLVENLFGFYISLEFKSVVAFAIIVVVLFFKPEGLFGRPYTRKV
ncbi:MAG: branched-chain amino acid ABC transporter permease [Saprospiraceae bacterium]|nr:branched-chain amino acid ABC transporter permease [Saprospiraceae bacterium]